MNSTKSSSSRRKSSRLDHCELPKSRKPRVLILGDREKTEVPALARKIRKHLGDRVNYLGADLLRHLKPITTKPDLVVVLGGDGAVLAASYRLGARRVPVLGVNFGDVGFLAGVAPDRAMTVLDRVLQGKGDCEDRAMMHAKVQRNRETLLDAHVLNEVVVSRDPAAGLVSADLLVDRRPVCTFRGDGVILSTATGSTAYNLAAGGPILSPRLEAWVVTPIAPHMLGMRSIVLPGHRVAILRVQEKATFTADGHQEYHLKAGDRIRVAPSSRRFRLLVDRDELFYARLRGKLHWGATPGES